MHASTDDMSPKTHPIVNSGVAKMLANGAISDSCWKVATENGRVAIFDERVRASGSAMAD